MKKFVKIRVGDNIRMFHVFSPIFFIFLKAVQKVKLAKEETK